MIRIPANPASREDPTVFVPPYDPRVVRLVKRINIILAVIVALALAAGHFFLYEQLFGAWERQNTSPPPAGWHLYVLSFVPIIALLTPPLAKGISWVLGLSLTRVYDETADAIEAWMPHPQFRTIGIDGGLFEGFWKIWRGPRSALAMAFGKENPRDDLLELARSLASAASGRRLVLTPTLGATELSSQNPEEGYELH